MDAIIYHITNALIRALNRYVIKDVVGAEFLPQKGTACIAAANHSDLADAFIFYNTILQLRTEPPQMVAYTDLFDEYVLSKVLNKTGAINVDPDDIHSLPRFIKEGLVALNKNRSCVAIFPEGHIIHTPNELGEGRAGTAILGIKTGCPIIPIGLIGVRGLIPRRGVLQLKRRSVTVNIGKPLSFAKHKDAYDAADRKQRRKIIDSCTTLLMQEISRLTNTPYPHAKQKQN